MKAAEKTSLADFIDLCADVIHTGYRSQQKSYNFTDDPAPEITSPNLVLEDISLRSDKSKNEEEKTAEFPDSLEIISDEIKSCTACSLCKTRKNAVPGEGAEQPEVMVIGEGPGADEDTTGRPFVGRAGQLLDKMLAAIDLSRTSNCFIANVIKCRPPGNRDPRPEETTACASFLERQILLLKPKIILSAGRISAQTLLKTQETTGKLRGNIGKIRVGDTIIPLIVTYHPSALLRNEEYKRPAWEDLKMLRGWLTEGT